MDPITLRELFAVNLRRLRYHRQISQEDLAYFAEVNRTYISKLEKGACYPGLAIIAKLAAVLEVEPAELLKPLPNAVSGEASEKPMLLPIDQTKALSTAF